MWKFCSPRDCTDKRDFSSKYSEILAPITEEKIKMRLIRGPYFHKEDNLRCYLLMIHDDTMYVPLPL